DAHVDFVRGQGHRALEFALGAWLLRHQLTEAAPASGGFHFAETRLTPGQRFGQVGSLAGAWVRPSVNPTLFTGVDEHAAALVVDQLDLAATYLDGGGL